MSVQALAAKSQAQNGVGSFIKACTRLDFHYCDHGGSSRGMLTFLKSGNTTGRGGGGSLAGLALRSPSVEMHVSPRANQHPVIRAHYVGGASRAICVRNLDDKQILAKALLLRDASGQKNRKLAGGRNVRSLNDGVRGVWSGLHADYASGEGVWAKMRSKKDKVPS